MSSLIIFSRRAVLRKWREKHSQNATYKNLAKCFYDVNRLDMVGSVCEVLDLGRRPLRNYHEEKQPGTVCSLG